MTSFSLFWGNWKEGERLSLCSHITCGEKPSVWDRRVLNTCSIKESSTKIHALKFLKRMFPNETIIRHYSLDTELPFCLGISSQHPTKLPTPLLRKFLCWNTVAFKWYLVMLWPALFVIIFDYYDYVWLFMRFVYSRLFLSWNRIKKYQGTREL